mmetsp:Transcript_5827/g.10743  ORF Transcript_5827/g.10743 Transcript_5827/m.10743 type:complete len:561 (-) Transcript_5827:18-1700(-)
MAAVGKLRRAGGVAARAAAAGAAGGAAVGVYLYYTKPGVQRAVRFWCHAGPIAVHYKWVSFRAPDQAEADARFEQLHARYAPDVRRAIEDLRGMFIKVGQVLSVRPEAVPDQYRMELRKLQDSAPPVRWDPIKTTLERDLNAPISELFESIEQEPLGAASIGQAHLVQWRGERAVVKVKYPDADVMLHADFWCLETLLWLCSMNNAHTVVTLLRKQFEVELDYEQEASNLQDLHDTIAASPEFRDLFVVPRPIPELTHGNVIGMSYLPGPKLETVLRARLEALGIKLDGRSFNDLIRAGERHHLDGPQSPGLPNASEESDPGSRSKGSSGASSEWLLRCGRVLSRFLGMDFLLWLLRVSLDTKLWLKPRGSSDVAKPDLDLGATLKRVLDVHGFQLFFCPAFNGDPHPGNILLLPDGRIGLIDFGQCKRLTDEQRAGLAELFAALAAAPAALDASQAADARIATAFEALGVRTVHGDRRFLAFVPRLMFGSLRPEWLDRSYLKEMLTRDNIELLPTHVIMAYRASMLLRGLCLTMQKNVSVADAWGAWAAQWLKLHPEHQ